MTKDLSELDTPDVGSIPLDLKVIREKVPTYTSDKLCEMIVCDRYFGCFRDVAVICMEELARRRSIGDTLDFESRIEQMQKALPPLTFQMPNLREALQSAMGNRNKK